MKDSMSLTKMIERTRNILFKMITSEKEIIAVCKLGAFERYQYFIKRVADSEKMYCLIDDIGYWAMANVEDRTVISFWSAPEYALMNAINDWDGFLVKEITVEEFEYDFADRIEKNNWLINIFPLKEKSGFVVDINEFARDLSEEMKKYQ